MSTANSDGVNDRTPWHAGEVALQARIGVAEHSGGNVKRGS